MKQKHPGKTPKSNLHKADSCGENDGGKKKKKGLIHSAALGRTPGLHSGLHNPLSTVTTPGERKAWRCGEGLQRCFRLCPERSCLLGGAGVVAGTTYCLQVPLVHVALSVCIPQHHGVSLFDTQFDPSCPRSTSCSRNRRAAEHGAQGLASRQCNLS